MAKTIEVVEFELVLEERRVRLSDPKTKVKTDYILRELDGTLRDQYLNVVGGKIKTDAKTGKSAGLKNFDGLQGSLVQKSIRQVTLIDPDDKASAIVAGSEKEVDLLTIQGWPAKVLDALDTMCKEMSALENEKGTSNPDEVLEKLVKAGVISHEVYTKATKFFEDEGTKSEADAKND